MVELGLCEFQPVGELSWFEFLQGKASISTQLLWRGIPGSFYRAVGKCDREGKTANKGNIIKEVTAVDNRNLITGISGKQYRPALELPHLRGIGNHLSTTSPSLRI